ncbi:MAG: SRPBCC family protein [Methylotenera sp.]
MSKTENIADREIVTSRVFDAPRELVWEAWTNPKHIVHWWGPNGFTTTIEKMDLRVGGEWKYMMVGQDGRCYPNHMVYKEVTRPSKLVSDHGDGERVWFEVSVTLQETGGGTLVTLRHLFSSKESRDEVVEKYGAIEGGKQHLAKLEAYIKEKLA